MGCSQVGKLLIAKSRQLSEENMELQSEIRQGSLCQAQAKLCLQRQHKHTLNALFKGTTYLLLLDSSHAITLVMSCSYDGIKIISI